MQSDSTLKRHARLVDEMAKARGVDLEEAIFRGKVTMFDLEDSVLRCTGCSDPAGCEHWLAAQQGAQAEETPGYCRNASLFRMLKQD
ncbi:DUF6455 family protein [Maliponia aquimaris]|uniref:DUF6455 domain-containing protein n=1 Tax=Maliponia aquimaris TaxID=1673631 RepID=A0A238KY14_9RHOB|nr:DUF6455 family protein [Maliponia aquimaris]SMX46946.1 hypothetical protein MAA8898_03565 [Maliponia aquimaris]